MSNREENKGVQITEFTTTYTTYNWSIMDDIGGMGSVFNEFIPTSAIPLGSWEGIHKSVKKKITGINELLFNEKFTLYMNEGDDLWKKLKDFELSELKRLSGKRKKTFTDTEYISTLGSFVDKSPNVFRTWPSVKDEISNNIKQLRDLIIDHENLNIQTTKQSIKLWLNRSTNDTPEYLPLIVADNKISFDYTLPKGGQKPIEDILLNIDRAFPRLRLDNLEQKDVKGYFDVKPSSIDKAFVEYIFMDMVTNDEEVSKFLSKMELDKTDKKWYTIGYHANGNNSIKPGLSFTVKSLGDTYETIRISIYDYQSFASIIDFRDQFLKIMERYETVFDSINADYEKFGISIGDEEDDEDDEDDDDDEDEKALEWSGKSSFCEKKRKPVGYTSETKAKEKWAKVFDNDKYKSGNVAFEKNNLVIERNSFEGDTWWICTNPKYPYIRMNDRGVPCCYKTYDTKKEGAKKSSYTIQTSAALTKSNSKGILNESVNFMTKYNEKGNKYMRYYMGADILTILINIRPDITLKGIRPELAKQESWAKCTSEIEKTLRKGNIDYRDYATLLEETFKVNIVVYNKNGRVLPNFKNGYFRRANDYPFVLMYDQSLTDDSPPSYVLIKNSPEENFIKGVPEIIDSKITLRVNGKETPRVDLADFLKEGWYVKYQKFDAYGKARRFVITDGVTSFNIQTTPQQPFDVPERLLPYIKPYSISQLEALKNVITIPSISSPTGAVFKAPGDSTFEIHVPRVVQENPESPYIASSPASEYVRSIKLKRTARIVTEHLLWSFVNDRLSEKDFDSKDALLVEMVKFISTIKVMDDDVSSYVNIGAKEFSKKSNLYKEDGSIQVYSSKIIYKLAYILQNMIIRNPDKLRMYKNAKFIPDFYKESTDFIPRFSQSIETSEDQDRFEGPKDFTCTLYDVFDDLDILIDRK